MRYLCVHCEEQFEPAEAESKPRCPKCMRVGSVRQVPEGAPRKPTTAKLAVALLLLVAAAVGGYALYTRDAMPDAAQLRREGLSVRVIEAELTRLGLSAGGLTQLLVPTDAVEAFAKKYAGTGAGASRAEALTKALQARADKAAFLRAGHEQARPGEFLMPDAVVAAIEKDGTRAELYPLELTALAVAALRAVGVDAMVAEVAAWPGRTAPLDPSGQLGYYAVALPAEGAGAAKIFDVYGSGDGQPPADQLKVLSDLEAIGAALGVRALGALAANGESSDVMGDVDTALKLWSGSATLRAARASVLLASGGTQQAQAELEAALQMRAEGPQRHNLSMFLLATGDVAGASKQIALALQQYPDFASAHVSLATVHMASREMDQARAALEKAERLDPDLASLAAAFAQYHAARGELPQALARAERAVALRPESPQPRLLLARMLRETGRYDDMRREARKALDQVPASQKERMKVLIAQLLGPTALERPEDEEAAAAAATGDAGAAREADLGDPAAMDLSRGSRLLGGADGKGESLLGGDSPLNLGGDAPKLRLGGSAGGLKLER